MDPRTVLSKLNMHVDHNGPQVKLELSWEESRALRSLITEMTIRLYGDNIDMIDWDKICQNVARGKW